jgi:hypothetical protein
LKSNNKIEAKRKIIGRETKQKNAVLISLWLEAKKLKRKKNKTFVSHERVKQIWFFFI